MRTNLRKGIWSSTLATVALTLTSAALAAEPATAPTPANAANPANTAKSAKPAAKPPAPLVNPEPGWHVIRPGDSLQSLAKKYLGDARYWTEIHRLNPGIDDPHWIYPGRRIRVVLERPSAAPNAQVTALARRVEARPDPVPWRPADQGDLLLDKDGLRTFENASAHLLFDDGTTATVSQDSLVFIRRQTAAKAAAPKKEIEVVLGQTDFEATRRASLPTPEIEVVVGGAKSTSRAGADGTVRSRSRKDGNGAQFMLYEGTGKVASKGGSVDLTAGTGTVVPAKSKPMPPESLLAAPSLLEPVDGDELGRDEPVLRWTPVAGAHTYVAEVCADAACGSVRERRSGIDKAEIRLADTLSPGESYWRVTAVASSGLDGFPSAPRRFTGVDAARPPVPTLTLLYGGDTPRAFGSPLQTPPQVQVRAVDRMGDDLPWHLLVDGAVATADDFSRLGVSGRHEVAAVAVDARGRESSSAAIAFELDASTPVVELPASADGEVVQQPKKPFLRWHKLREDPQPRPCETGIEVFDGASWVPIACAGAPATEIAMSGTASEIRLRTTRPLVVGEKRAVPAGIEAPLEVSDVGSGLAMAHIQVIESPYRDAKGRSLLTVEVVDRAGRTGKADWQLELK